MATTEIEKIKNLYQEIPNKSKFFFEMSKEFGAKPSSLKTNWFSVYSIPNNKVGAVIKFMESYLSKF